MLAQSRKWATLVATTWIMAFTGTNFDFSSYSSTLKSVLGISQLQLTYLSVASDMGKAFGWCSGVSLLYFPLWAVMFMAAFLGIVAYGLQWLLIKQLIALPYVVVFLVCLLAGCSICWFNTVCYVLCIRNFNNSRAMALSLTVAFNGLSAALYTLLANAIETNDDDIYLFLNAVVPLLTSAAALLPILAEPPVGSNPTDATRHESRIFVVLYVLAVITGMYLLFLNPVASVASWARLLFVGALLLLALPLCLPGIICAEEWPGTRDQMSFQDTAFSNEPELDKELINWGHRTEGHASSGGVMAEEGCFGCFGKVMEQGRLTVLGEEHPAGLLVRRRDFWLYYLTYLCGGTIGIAYSNNLGQIAQSLGLSSQLNALVSIYSSCSFFGRLLAAAPDFLHNKMYFARTGWLAISLVPTPIALFLLVASGSEAAARIGTGLIGLSSGFVFAASVSVTSELFGPNSAGVNHNILITNIPVGSLLYGLLAALIYDSNAGGSTLGAVWLREEIVCMGKHCYLQTFVWWGCFSLFGLACSLVLYLRTRSAYGIPASRRTHLRQMQTSLDPAHG